MIPRLSAVRRPAFPVRLLTILCALWLCPVQGAVGKDAEPLFEDGAGAAPVSAGHVRAVRTHSALPALGRVRIDLGGGRSVVARRERMDWHGAKDYVWVGRVEGQPLSRVTIASHNGVIAGHVDMPAPGNGGEAYQLVPTPSGATVFMPATSSALVDGCGGALPPPTVGKPRLALDTTGGTALTTTALATNAVASTTNQVVVDVMVVYTPASAATYGTNGIEAMILQAISDGNTGFANSGVFVTLNLVYMGMVNYTETGNIINALSALQNPSDGVMDEVQTLRNQYGADLVSLVDQDASACGIGFIMTSVGVDFAPYAFSVVYAGCLSYYSLAHEMSHNMGCDHDRANTSGGGAYPYSYGYAYCSGDASAFRTVMSYSCSGSVAPRVNLMSNPNLTYNGIPTGIAYETDPTNSADNTRTINNTAATVAAFRSGPVVLPAAPADLSAAAVAFNQANLAWIQPDTNATGFKVERSPDAASWTEIASITGTATAYADTALAPSTTYYYRVQSFNAAGCSSYSPAAGATTPSAPVPPPSAPAGLTATAVSTSQINLAWTDTSTNESGFTIERSTDGVNFAQLAQVAAGTQAYADASVAPGQTCYYRVSAFNAAGASAASNIASATTPEGAAPAAPSNLAATAASTSSIALKWNDNSTNERGFLVERSLDGVNFLQVASLSSNVTSYADSGLSGGTKYYYRVRAWRIGVTSAYSNVASATTMTAVPAAPSNLIASAVPNKQIKLAWVDNSNTETGYRVERSTDRVNFSTVANLGANVTSYTNTRLSVGTTYYYRVRALNSAGVSAPSNVASAKATR